MPTKDTLGLAPPAGAHMLFDGTAQSLRLQWTRWDGSPARWPVRKGETMLSRGGDICTRERFLDFHLHLEFCCPRSPRWFPEQFRGNSGVFLQGRYEIQVLDSWGLQRAVDARDCGALYGYTAPQRNASRPPGEWQTYDVDFRAPRFGPEGTMQEGARITVYQNGHLIHESTEMRRGTRTFPGDTNLADPGPLRLQDHYCSVLFRNIWLLPR